MKHHRAGQRAQWILAAWGLELRSPELHQSQTQCSGPVISVLGWGGDYWGGRDRQIPWDCWSTSLAELQVRWEILCQKKKVESNEGNINLWTPQTCSGWLTCTYVHTHTLDTWEPRINHHKPTRYLDICLNSLTASIGSKKGNNDLIILPNLLQVVLTSSLE